MSKLDEFVKENRRTRSISIKEIIEKFGGVVTITGLSYRESDGKQTPVFDVVENNGALLWCNITGLKNVVDKLLEKYDGDLNKLNAELSVQGLQIEIGSTFVKTKKGNDCRPVSILGTVKLNDKPSNCEPDEIKPPDDIDTPF